MKLNIDQAMLEFKSIGECFNYDERTNDYINLITHKFNILENMSLIKLVNNEYAKCKELQVLEDVLLDKSLDYTATEADKNVSSASSAALYHKLDKVLAKNVKLARSAEKSVLAMAQKNKASSGDMQDIKKTYTKLIDDLYKSSNVVSKKNSKNADYGKLGNNLTNIFGKSPNKGGIKQTHKEIDKLDKAVNKAMLKIWFDVKKNKKITNPDTDLVIKNISRISKSISSM